MNTTIYVGKNDEGQTQLTMILSYSNHNSFVTLILSRNYEFQKNAWVHLSEPRKKGAMIGCNPFPICPRDIVTDNL